MQTFGVEQRFGFNKITPALWLADMAKGLGAGVWLLGLPLLVGGAVAHASRWRNGGGCGPGGCWWAGSCFLMAIAPNVIMPLFNKFTPLEDESLKARVQGLMQRAGFTAKGFFVMDGSRRSAHSNAFFHRLWGQQARGVF